ncbi:glucan biosynthesis protein G [Gemmobacter sp.]|uniref:glucan biosynthesis protein n=1 Tax=Gemmobacter sp. TaxID=1898957 RepID=UPI002AFF4BF2|nr:glucan biosynthesis protein G [Gemmobacter sp.]
MTTVDPSIARLSRRQLLATAAALSAVVPLTAFAQQSGIAPAAPQQFSFDLLTEEMRQIATLPYQAAPNAQGLLADLDYDDYRLVSFRPDRMRWQADNAGWSLAAFPMGWLFKEPVILYEVVGAEARELRFSTEDFEYLNDLATRVPPMTELPGVAGFRLHHPLNRPDVMDEVVAFIGASYFRALGRGSAYGASARGLAVNTATARGEEFPRFSRFYIERGTSPDSITIYARLNSPSVTGAYRFVLFPGADTVMEVTARLFFRADVQELGIAPLTSMFMFSEKNRAEFDDFRPNVHDSDGLRIVRADGQVIWRPLNNPPRLTGSYFPEAAPRRFGLHQRDRRFESYQDTEAQYHLRPSVDVEPMGDWGKGFVRLVEIPSESEANDNIVAYWLPETPAKAGDAREFAYRLHWGDLPLDPASRLAHVVETRAGHGGVAGGPAQENERKFVIDFGGGVLGTLGADARLDPTISVSNGQVLETVLQHIPETGAWRLVIDVSAERDAVVELSAHLVGYGRRVTETWLYQWINAQ